MTEQMLLTLTASDFRNMIADVLRKEMLSFQGLLETPSEQQFYTFKEVLVCFGVTRPTVNKWMKSGLNYYKKGSRVYFDVKEVEQFIKSS